MGIYFQGSNAYNASTYRVFDAIEQNPAGRVIIAGIRNSPRNLVFVPMSLKDIADHGPCNGMTIGVNTQAQAPLGVSARSGTFFRGDEDNVMTREDERYNFVPPSWIGTGEGTDVTLHFDVNQYRRRRCSSGPASQADDVLFHEMVHALRFMQGKANHVPTDDLFYDNDEEFLAVVATNVYISANGRTDLRANHHEHELLRPPLNTSEGFLANQDNLKVLSIYRLVWSDTFNGFAMITAAQFNPFRQLAANLAYLGQI